MKVVPVEEIPTLEKITDIPEDLLEVYKICKQMEKVCIDCSGIGLHAVQVGIPWNLFIVKTNDEFEYYVNCGYEPVGDEKTTSIEGCLSLLDEENNFRRFQMVRHMVVKVSGSKLVRGEKDLTLVDFCENIHAENQGVVFQHEIDHSLSVEGLISKLGKEILIW